MSVLIGAERIQDKHGTEYRLSIHPRSVAGKHGWKQVGYRFSRLNGWHCGHWHRTPEDALSCAIAKGAPMQ